MGSVNIVVFIESARSMIARESDNETNALHLASLIEVSAAWGAPSPLPLLPRPRLRPPLPLLTWRSVRREVCPLSVLLPPPQAVQPGPSPVGGPQERPLDQRFRYVRSRAPERHSRPLNRASLSTGVLMSAGGSKIIWCKHGFDASMAFNTDRLISTRLGPPRSHDSAYTAPGSSFTYHDH